MRLEETGSGRVPCRPTPDGVQQRVRRPAAAHETKLVGTRRPAWPGDDDGDAVGARLVSTFGAAPG
jgi:hypothetical protein